jgi:hypothetical protein
MGIPTQEIEKAMAYAESQLGCVLVIETSGSAYGATKASDGFNTVSAVVNRLKVTTGKTTSQMGTREQVVQPEIKKLTG